MIGSDPQLYKIFPAIQYPVSRGTPNLSRLIKWAHNLNLGFVSFKSNDDQLYGYQLMMMNSREMNWNWITGHVIDGRNLYPATGYLSLVWNLFATVNTKIIKECAVTFENVRFIRAVNIPKTEYVELVITIQKSTGRFEVSYFVESFSCLYM